MNGTWYTTQVSAPIACHCLQCRDRQPPTLIGRSSPSGRLLPGPLTFTSRAAGASGGRGKGSLAFAFLLPLARLAQGRRRSRLLLCLGSTRGACLTRASSRGSCRLTRRRRFPRNPGRVESPLHKSVTSSSAHLEQSGIQ